MQEVGGIRTAGQASSGTRRVAAAGGELLGAAFKFLGELVAQHPAAPPAAELVASVHNGLKACVEENADGQPKLTVTLPDRGALDQLAQALARLLTVGGAAGQS